MPFINVGSGNDLIIKIPTERTTNWNTSFKNNFALKIAEHNHTGSGKGRQITTSAIAVDSITGTLIRLDNNEYLKGRNQANSANINLVKINTSDKLAVGVDFVNLDMINNSALKFRNQADSAYIDVIKLNASDKIELGADITAIAIANNVSYRSRNQADNGYISLLKANTSDKIVAGADFTNLALINNQYFRWRNNADSGHINVFKIKTDDTLDIQPDTTFAANLSYSGLRQSVNKTFTIADNQSAATITGATVNEVAGSSFKLIYSIYIDATTDLLEKGESEFSYDGSSWEQKNIYSRNDALVVFSVVSGQLKYDSATYAGYMNGTLTYQIIEF